MYGALVDQANQEEESKRKNNNIELKNVYYISANINKCLKSLQLSLTYIQRVSILFPDPWGCGTANSKNKKRRVVTPEFASLLASCLPTGAAVYFASDWQELALDIRFQLESTKCFIISPEPTLSARQLLEKYQRPHSIISTPSSEYRFIDEKYKKPVDLTSPELWLDHVPFGGVLSERDIVCENQCTL